MNEKEHSFFSEHARARERMRLSLTRISNICIATNRNDDGNGEKNPSMDLLFSV